MAEQISEHEYDPVPGVHVNVKVKRVTRVEQGRQLPPRLPAQHGANPQVRIVIKNGWLFRVPLYVGGLFILAGLVEMVARNLVLGIMLLVVGATDTIIAGYLSGAQSNAVKAALAQVPAAAAAPETVETAAPAEEPPASA